MTAPAEWRPRRLPPPYDELRHRCRVCKGDADGTAAFQRRDGLCHVCFRLRLAAWNDIAVEMGKAGNA